MGLLIASISILMGNQRGMAGDLLFVSTRPDTQASVVIGEVLSIEQNRLTFEPKRVLRGKRVPKQVTVIDYDPTQLESLSDGDAAVLTLRQVDGKGMYELDFVVFKVSSSEPSEAHVLAGPLSGGDRIAYNWFINSCGAERDFAFNYSKDVDIAYVRKEAELVVIAQRLEKEPDGNWIMTAGKPVCEPLKAASWWRVLVEQLKAAPAEKGLL